MALSTDVITTNTVVINNTESDTLTQTTIDVISLEKYCGSEDKGYQFFLYCQQMSNNITTQIWEIPQDKTLILKHFVILPPNITLRGGTILIDNPSLDTFSAQHSGIICIFKDNITIDSVNVIVNNGNSGMTLFAIRDANNFTVKHSKIVMNSNFKYQAIFYFFRKNKDIHFINTDIISNTTGVNGAPILISNQTTDTSDACESKNFIFDKCNIESNSGDEVISIMSQLNIVRNIYFNNCTIIRKKGATVKFIITIFSKNETTTKAVNSHVENVNINNCTIIDMSSSVTNNMIIRIGYTGNIDDVKNIRIKNCQIYGNISSGCSAIIIEPVVKNANIKIDDCYIENTSTSKGYAITNYDTFKSVQVTNCDVINLLISNDLSKSINKNILVDGQNIAYYSIADNVIAEDGFIELENEMTLQWLKHKYITAINGNPQFLTLPKQYSDFYGAYYSTFNSKSSSNISISNSGVNQIIVTNFASEPTTIDILCLTH